MFRRSLFFALVFVSIFNFAFSQKPEYRSNGKRYMTERMGWNTVPRDMEKDFKNPPREAGVRCWWWWLNSNVTKEAITRDIEAMHEKGFSGAMIFDAGTELKWGPDSAIPNGPQFGGPKWTELYLHALREAKRLDMEIGLSIQSGWNLGGPGVTLDDKAKQITTSEILVEGGQKINAKLPMPKHNYEYYRDICVLAYPTKVIEGLPFKLSASSSQSKFSVTNIAGGDFWVSSGTKSGEGPTVQSPEWIEFAFEEPVTVSGLNLTGRKGYGPKVCWLEATDTKQKTNAFKLKNGLNELSFDAVKGKSVRIVFEDSYDPTYPDSPRNVQVVSAKLLGEDGKSLTAGQGADRKPISNLEAKTGAKELGGSAPDCRFLLNDYSAVDGEEDTLLRDIIDISEKVSDDGRLKWDAPAGQWTVLRIGYTPTHAHVATSSDNWKGHVVDYLSKDVFNRYWYDVVDPLLQKAGPMAGTVLKQLETDSWECGGMNWSPGFADEFKRYNGYDIKKYLPVVAGKIVDSREASNAFLADLRKTIAHLVSENHYKTFAENAAKYNIGIQPECSGPHAGPVDGITNYSHSDIVMSEFWIPSPHRPNPPNRFFVKQAASAAHIYGKQFVGAESFTSLKKPHWAVELWHDMKPAMDYEFCEGLNMIFFHTFTCSPKEMGIPGQEYFAGTHVNPQVTWWDRSDAFMDYIKRIQSVVQKGDFVADVLYYYGDQVPNIAVNKGFNQAGSLPGYDYDVTNEEVLLELKVVDGNVVVPGGVEYRVLVLPDHKVLSLAVLEKVEKLLAQGATVIGPKPERLVSLVGREFAQQKFHELADKLWGSNSTKAGQKRIGKGKLVLGQTSREFLQSEGVAFDFEVLDVEKQTDYQYIHYTINGDDVYFVCNQTKQPQSVDCAFRISGKQPELWDPVTGEITRADAFKHADDITTIPMEFDPYGSSLVVFRKSIPETKQGTARSNYPKLNVVKEVAGSWNVVFDTEWGGPGSVEFKTLTDWTQHADEGIKYYSGEAVYTNRFELKPVGGKCYWLQLNNVLDAGIASVKLNGKDIGITWTTPFRLEITDAVKSGKNKLEITVVNTWQNRLIGDRGKDQKDRFTKTNIRVKDEWELRSSGLIGPVEIISNQSGPFSVKPFDQ